LLQRLDTVEEPDNGNAREEEYLGNNHHQGFHSWICQTHVCILSNCSYADTLTFSAAPEDITIPDSYQANTDQPNRFERFLASTILLLYSRVILSSNISFCHFNFKPYVMYVIIEMRLSIFPCVRNQWTINAISWFLNHEKMIYYYHHLYICFCECFETGLITKEMTKHKWT
jgi:hypothetical protein